MAFAFGALGWAAKRYDYPAAPMILGVVLGQSFERAVVQSAEIGRGSLSVYFHRPIALVLLALAVLMAAGPTIFKQLRKRRDPGAPPPGAPRPSETLQSLGV
jgi:putative tricarboxylic transport membrane protein